MNILPFHLNEPAEVILERPEGVIVQGRYGDRVMFTLADGQIMYVPPFVPAKIQAEGVAAGDRLQLCKTQIQNGNRRSIEWTVRRLDHSEPETETPIERDLSASIELVAPKTNGHNGTQASVKAAPPVPPTKLEHALKAAISAAYNAERYGAELGYVVRFDADAIKSMAITVLINMSSGNQR